jgi:hypothetical protein
MIRFFFGTTASTNSDESDAYASKTNLISHQPPAPVLPDKNPPRDAENDVPSVALVPRPTLQRRITQEVETVVHTSLLCGLLAGVAQAGVFNPYDRALYLAMIHNRPFLTLDNWRHPYRGFGQSVSTRALSGGLFFPLEHFFLKGMLNFHFGRTGFSVPFIADCASPFLCLHCPI